MSEPPAAAVVVVCSGHHRGRADSVAMTLLLLVMLGAGAGVVAVVVVVVVVVVLHYIPPSAYIYTCRHHRSCVHRIPVRRRAAQCFAMLTWPVMSTVETSTLALMPPFMYAAASIIARINYW